MKRKYIKTLAFGMALTCAVPAMAQNKVVTDFDREQKFLHFHPATTVLFHG